MENAMFQNRFKLSPEKSLKSLYEYAYLADMKQRSHFQRLQRGHFLIIGTIGTLCVFFVGYGCVQGVWANLSPNNQVVNLMKLVNSEARSLYRPELFMKDKYAKDILEQQKNPAENPLKLWH